MMTLHEKIGKEKIEQVIAEFYNRAFQDVMIGHFFFNIDQDQITKQQITFASAMLGSKEIQYAGKPITKAHKIFAIRPPHFNRRQVIMREVLRDLDVNQELSEEWLAREEHLKKLIINSGQCNQ